MAHEYKATIAWTRGDQVFTDRRYSRAHEWRFDGGVVVPGSPAPSVVKAPMSREDAVDPEEAFVAALSSCHMLFFLDFTAKAGFRIDSYTDDAVGVMTKDAATGKVWISKVTLAPRLVVSGNKRPTDADIADLHHKAHEACFISNSVKSEVVISQPPLAFA